MKLTPSTREAVLAAARSHTDGAWAAFATRHATALGVSAKTIYRALREAGLGPQRRRAKQGSVITDEDALKAHHVIRATKRRNGMVLADTKTAVEILEDSGLVPAGVSVATWNRRLREAGVAARAVKAPRPYRPITSGHPNALWQMDATPCVMYTVGGRGRIITRKAFELEVSRKPSDLRKVREHLIRYVVVDHKSGGYFFQYVNASGERVEDVINFTFAAMTDKGHPQYPFRGVPFELWTDPGAAFTAAPMRNLCAALGVALNAHMPGNPRAKGAVENANRWIPAKFESRLSFVEPPDLDTLNAWAMDYLVRANAESNFRGTGEPRARLWLSITAEQLRELPVVDGMTDKEFFGRLAATEPVTRRAGANLIINYGGREYRLPNVPALAGQQVSVHLDAWSYPRVIVTAWRGTEREERYELAPLERDRYGQVASAEHCQRPGAPRAVADGPVEAAGKQAEEFLAGYGVEFKGSGQHRRAFPRRDHNGPRLAVFGHQADKVAGLPTLMPRKGTPLENPARAATASRLAPLDAIEVIAAELGRGLVVAENEHVYRAYSGGMTRDDVEETLALFRAQEGRGKVAAIAAQA